MNEEICERNLFRALDDDSLRIMMHSGNMFIVCMVLSLMFGLIHSRYLSYPSIEGLKDIELTLKQKNKIFDDNIVTPLTAEISTPFSPKRDNSVQSSDGRMVSVFSYDGSVPSLSTDQLLVSNPASAVAEFAEDQNPQDRNQSLYRPYDESAGSDVNSDLEDESLLGGLSISSISSSIASVSPCQVVDVQDGISNT